MIFGKIFNKIFKKTKKTKKIESPAREEIEAAAKYRLVYNSKKKKYEKILVYSEVELEDG